MIFIKKGLEYPTIVNEFIKKIIVPAPDKSSGHRVQKIQIILILSVNLSHKTNLSPIKRRFILQLQ